MSCLVLSSFPSSLFAHVAILRTARDVTGHLIFVYSFLGLAAKLLKVVPETGHSVYLEEEGALTSIVMSWGGERRKACVS